MTVFDQLKDHKNKAVSAVAVALLASLGIVSIPEDAQPANQLQPVAEVRTCEGVAKEAGVNAERGANAYNAGDTQTVAAMQKANAILADEFAALDCPPKQTPWQACGDDLACRKTLINACIASGVAKDYQSCKRVLKNA